MTPADAPAAGDLVAARLPSGPRIGVVRAIHGNRAEISVSARGRSASVPRRTCDRLAALPPLWPTDQLPQSPEQAPWHISEARLLAAAPRARELGQAWLLLADPKSGEVDGLCGLLELVGDAADPAQRAALWLWLEGGQTLFRWRGQRIEPRPLNELRALRLERRRRVLADQRLRQWHQRVRCRQPLTGDLHPEQLEDLRLLRRWAGGDTSLPLPEPLNLLLHEANCAPEPGAIRHLLVDLGQWDRHHLPALEASPWQQGFTESQLAEAERLILLAQEDRPGDALRRDLCGQRVVTIDDEDTREIDDGLALEWLGPEQPRIWIHIADPGRLVEGDSPLDQEAARRASSLYLARGTVPMFPPGLAHGPMSLRAGERCAAWSLWVDLDTEGRVVADGVLRSWIKPRYRLTYADADALLELAPPQERDLLTLADLLQRRQRWRLQRGALQLDDPEGRLRVRQFSAATTANPDGLEESRCEPVAEIEVIEGSPSRQMVAEAMVLAGAIVAERGRRDGLALPYRSQAVCSLPSEAELAALPPGPVRHAAIKRCLSRGLLGTAPAPHFSLGLSAYVQATSPIRRYGDLLVQRQLASLLEGRAPLGEAALAARLADLEPALRQGIQIQRDDQRHWLQVWFTQQPRQAIAALFLRWLRADQQLGLVWLDDLALSLPCHCPSRSEPGGRLLVRVLEVDPLRDRLQLEASA